MLTILLGGGIFPLAAAESDLDPSARVAALTGELAAAPADKQDGLRCSLAGAQLAVGALADARATLAPVLKAAASPERQRAALLWVAVWQREWRAADHPAELPAVAAGLAAFGDLGPIVAARCATAEAERLLTIDRGPGGAEAAVVLYDKALAALKNAPPAEREPVYALRVAAMERGGVQPAEIQAWLVGHKDDPAAVTALAAAMGQ
jgi:hypothetical protein